MQYPSDQPKDIIQTAQGERPVAPYEQPAPVMPPSVMPHQQHQYPPVPMQHPQYPQQQQWQQPPYPYQQQMPYQQPMPQYAPQPQQPIMIVNNVSAQSNATAMAGMMPLQKTQYSFMVRLIYFCCIGLWAGMAWAGIALLFCCTIVGIPLGMTMLNKLPAVLTLQR